MSDPIAEWSAFLAFLVSTAMFAWCLLRAARSLPSFLLSMLLGCIAGWNLFEWLWWLSHPANKDDHLRWIQLEFIGASLAPAAGFHYALSLSPPWKIRATLVTLVYVGAFVFLAIPIGGFFSDWLLALFKDDGYSEAYLIFFIPVVIATFLLLERSRRKARDPGARSLFAYPLMAGLLMVPLGFTELTLTMINPHFPRFASLGGLIGSTIIAVGVIRHRAVYDAFAVLRRDSANVLRAVVQGVLYLEPDGRVIFSNSVARDLLGMAPGTLSETGLEVPSTEKSLVRRGTRLLELRGAKSEDVFPPGRHSLILQDKTRDYELMEALASKEALASLGQAAAILAHEIRNPLTGITSALDCVVHDTTRGQKPEDRHLGLIRSGVDRLNDLLERTLELSRPLKLDRQSCDLNRLVERTVSTHFGTDGSRVIPTLAPDLPPISADPDRIAQVVINLVKNGVEASQEVRIATSRLPQSVSLRVTSPGSRIPEAVVPQLFKPFVTTKPGGNGLGLAICQKIAQAHDGEILGRNGADGAEFELRLPL